MNTLQIDAARTKQLTERHKLRLSIIIAFMLAGMLSSYEALAGSTGWRFSDPSFFANGVKACPGLFGCSFEVKARDINVDALKCPQGKNAFDPGCDTPGHQQVDINVSAITHLEDCTRNGSCKLRTEEALPLDGLAAIIESLPPGGLHVPSYTDAGGEICPALVIRSMVTDIIGFVCDANGIDANGQCVSGNVNAYFNGIGTFNPMFEGDFADELCMHGNFSEPLNVICYDPDAPYACSSNFPLAP